MLKELQSAISMMFIMIALTGIAYPLAMTGLAGTLFPTEAAGSLIVSDGTVIGSALVGQDFTGEGYFHPRPSAAGSGYSADDSSGSNLGPTSKALVEAVTERAKTAGASPSNPVPVDLVTASGSGLDPHISPEAATFQVSRVAAARNIGKARLQRLIDTATERPTFDFLGEPRVNVLKLNLALDELTGKTVNKSND